MLTDKTLDFIRQAGGQLHGPLGGLAAGSGLTDAPPGSPLTATAGAAVSAAASSAPPQPPPARASPAGTHHAPPLSDSDSLVRHRVDMVLALIRGAERLEDLAARNHVSADAILRWRDEFLAAGHARLATIEPLTHRSTNRQPAGNICPSCAEKTESHA